MKHSYYIILQIYTPSTAHQRAVTLNLCPAVKGQRDDADEPNKQFRLDAGLRTCRACIDRATR
jgi:hypothetical protein